MHCSKTLIFIAKKIDNNTMRENIAEIISPIFLKTLITIIRYSFCIMFNGLSSLRFSKKKKKKEKILAVHFSYNSDIRGVLNTICRFRVDLVKKKKKTYRFSAVANPYENI